MPELPEVETTRQGLLSHVLNQSVIDVNVYQGALRWPVDAGALKKGLLNGVITDISRRGKYLLFKNKTGTMICHLGMSGSLRVVTNGEVRRKHDHVEWLFGSGVIMRFHDPRRFGCVIWYQGEIHEHKLLKSLGPEPLCRQFNADYLYQRASKRKQAVKLFMMNSNIVVGVGNIYASEALFLAGIHPARQAGRISKNRYELLVKAIKQTLRKAIKSGGTTLRDFVNSQGEPGYFRQKLNVYEKASQPCIHCHTPIKRIVQANRASYYCPRCQT